MICKVLPVFKRFRKFRKFLIYEISDRKSVIPTVKFPLFIHKTQEYAILYFIRCRLINHRKCINLYCMTAYTKIPCLTKYSKNTRESQKVRKLKKYES